MNTPTPQQHPESTRGASTPQHPAPYRGGVGCAGCDVEGPNTPAFSIRQTLPKLPALVGLARLRDCRPVVIIDTREQTPLTFTRLPCITGTLTTGDYSFGGAEELFAVERKSIADLVACCVGDNRDRFFRELHRLRGYRFKRLLIVGSREEIEAGVYRSRITPAAVLATVTTIETRFDVPAVFAATPADAARMVETWAWYFARELVESCNDLLRGTEAAQPEEAA